MFATVVQILLIIFFPYLAKKIAKSTFSWLSPVVLCYSLGILLANISLIPINDPIANYFTQGTILLAIPFLLFSTKLAGWMEDFKPMVLSFILCILCGILGTSITGWYFANWVENAGQMAGMIAAIFSGGIPNMQAVGLALEANTETIVLLNAADLVIGGPFLIFLTSIGSSFLALFLKDYQTGNFYLSKENFLESKIISKNGFILGLITALMIIGISVGLSFIIYKSIAPTFIILALTTFSILATRIKQIKRLSGTFEVGDYLLLMFCVAVGMLADFGDILVNGIEIIRFMGVAWGLTVILHWVLCYLFGIDKDSVMIASTAAIYGPVFIGQIASTIENRRLVFPGIALGLLGIAMGNYIGIFVAWMLAGFS